MYVFLFVRATMQGGAQLENIALQYSRPVLRLELRKQRVTRKLLMLSYRGSNYRM